MGSERTMWNVNTKEELDCLHLLCLILLFGGGGFSFQNVRKAAAVLQAAYIMRSWLKHFTKNRKQQFVQRCLFRSIQRGRDWNVTQVLSIEEDNDVAFTSITRFIT